MQTFGHVEVEAPSPAPHPKSQGFPLDSPLMVPPRSSSSSTRSTSTCGRSSASPTASTPTSPTPWPCSRASCHKWSRSTGAPPGSTSVQTRWAGAVQRPHPSPQALWVLPGLLSISLPPSPGFPSRGGDGLQELDEPQQGRRGDHVPEAHQGGSGLPHGAVLGAAGAHVGRHAEEDQRGSPAG